MKESRKRAVCELSQTAFFLYHFFRREEKKMRNWVERLVKCGIPEKTAQGIIDFFWKRRRTVELIAYVRMTEEATGKR